MCRPLPPPADVGARPRDLLRALANHLGESGAVAVCADLLGGADAMAHRDVLPYLAGRPGTAYPKDEGWGDHWPRVWGARGLLYVWDETPTSAVLSGLEDPAWRVAEMCLKVCARRELPAGDAGVRLASHELSRVRAVAMRALGAAGDVEHVGTVQDALDDESVDVRQAAHRAIEAMRARLDLGRLGAD